MFSVREKTNDIIIYLLHAIKHVIFCWIFSKFFQFYGFEIIAIKNLNKEGDIRMSVRFEKVTQENRTIIQISGDLRGRGVVELERLCREISGPVALDLSCLQSSEDQGVNLIRELSQKGIELCGVTPYMDLLLK